MSEANAEVDVRKKAKSSTDASPPSVSVRDSNGTDHQASVEHGSLLSMTALPPYPGNVPPNGLPVAVPMAPGAFLTSGNYMDPTMMQMTSPGMVNAYNLNEQLQRQQVFANLSSASMGPAAPPDVFLSFLLSQQNQQQRPETQNALVQQYLLMNAMNRMQHLQSCMPLAGPFAQGPTGMSPQWNGNMLQPMQRTMLDHSLPQNTVDMQSVVSHGLGPGGSAAAPATALGHNPPLQSQAPVSIGPGVPHTLPVLLSRPTDSVKLSSLQALLRQQIQVFQATEVDIGTHVRGRNKTIKLGQVGIRCRHCAHVPAVNRYKGSTYFPTSVWGLYQASQNMCNMHLQEGSCREMPHGVKQEFLTLLDTKKAANTSGAGRSYWATTAQELGLVDTLDGIFFVRQLPADARFPTSDGDEPGVYRKCGKRKEIAAAPSTPSTGR